MTHVEERRDRYASALADVRRAEADRSQLLTVLDAVADRYEATRRGDDPGNAEAIVADLVTVAGDWDYGREELSAVGLTADGPRFDDFDVERPADVPEALAEAYADDDERAFGDLVRCVRNAVAGGGEQFAALTATVDDLVAAFRTRDDVRFEAAAEALVDGFHDREVDSASDLETLFEGPDDPFYGAGLLTLQEDEGARHEVAERLDEAIDAGDREAYVEARRPVERAGRALDTFATRRRVDLADAVGSLADAYPADHDDPLPGLEGETPVLLTPTRLETTFVRRTDAQGEPVEDAPRHELMVRVYPDDLHVDTHERALTEAEVEAGARFWEQVWWANHAGKPTAFEATLPEAMLEGVDLRTFPTDRSERHAAVRERAWNRLVERFGPERAAWVKRAMAPERAEALLSGSPGLGHVEDADVAGFEAEMETIREAVDRRPGAWTRPPRARLLPDRWIAVAETNEDEVTATSEPVEVPLSIGPDPGSLDSSVEAAADGPAFREGEMEWVFDFETAEDVGMALRVPLTAEQADAGVDRLVVLGVSTGRDGTEGALALADLLEGHRYTDGLALLERGTPTNDTRDDSAASAPSGDPTPYERACVEPPVAPGDEDADGARLAELLGIGPDVVGGSESFVLDRVPGAGKSTEATASAANAALWSATWGYYVPHFLAPLDWAENVLQRERLLEWLENYRRHFVAFVRAGGPAPPLRVGDQPYGVVPTTAYDDWTAVPDLATTPESPALDGAADFDFARIADDDVSTHLAGLLDSLRPAWETARENVPTVDSGDDPAIVASDLLSMAGTGYGYRLRELLGSEAAATLLDPADVESEFDEARATVGAQLETATGYGDVPRIGDLLADEHADVVDAPVATDDLSSTLRALRTTRHDGLRTGPPGVDAGLGLGGPGTFDLWLWDLFAGGTDHSLAEVLAYHAILQEYRLARVRLAHHYEEWAQRTEEGVLGWNELPWSLVPEPGTYDDGDLTMWAALEHDVPDALQSHPDFVEGWTVGDFVREVPAVDRPFAELRSAFETLEGAEPAATERAVRETLDLASHRLDAWATSLATRRLDGMREAGGEGVYVGAYGYLEDVERETGSRSAGYVQAPSVDQATAAAVLRSAHDAEHDEYGDLFAVDLSADRVREALDLLEGVRAGHSLGELLGARFERALHEDDSGAELDQYVYAFRALAPLVEGRVEGDDTEESDAVAERETVDGVTLHDLWRDDAIPWGDQVGRVEIDALPPEPPTDDAEPDPAYEAIVGEIEAIGTALDSLSDVLAAESVYHLVRGNPERAGGAMDALSRGGAVDDVEVVETPRTGTSCTHRVLALFDPGATGSAWAPGDSPRAAAEPAIDEWLGTLLGDPDRAVCRVAFRAKPADGSDSDGDTSSDSSGEDAAADDDAADLPWRVTAVRLSALGLSALDLVSLVSTDENAWAAELESRIEHHLRRTREDVAADGEVRLAFTPPADWPDARALGADPDEDVGFGELLEVARVAREVVAGGRSLDARDLSVPGEATDEGQVVGDLDDRADAAIDGLATALDSLGPQADALAADSETDERVVDDLHALADSLAGVPTADVGDAERALSAVDPSDLHADLDALAEAFAGQRVLVAHVGDGSVALSPDESVVEGLAGPGTTLTLEARAGGQTLDEATVSPDRTGRFAARLDVARLTVGDAFEIVVEDGDGRSDAVEARYVQRRDRHAVVGEATRYLADALDPIRAVADAAEPAERADAALDAGVIDAAVAAFDAADWSADAAADLAAVRDAPTANVPGVETPAAWNRVAPVADAVGEIGAEQVQAAKLHRGVPSERDFAALLDAIDDGLTTLADGVAAAERRPDQAFVAAALETVRDALLACADYGLQGCVPLSARGTARSDLEALARQGASVHAEASERLATATDHRDRGDAAGDPDAYVACLEALFGEKFTVLVPFEPTAPGELANALAPAHGEALQNGDPLAVERWFDRTGRIRDDARTFGRALTYGETVGARSPADGARFRVGQLPYEAEDDWVGLPDAWADEHPSGRLSLVAHVQGDQPGDRYVGLFVDEFVETVPNETETTGLSVHYDRPASQAPQSMLLAVPPTDEDWSVETLLSVVRESVELAKVRTVDRDALDAGGHLLPGLALATNESADPAGPDTASVEPEALMADWWPVPGWGGGD